MVLQSTLTEMFSPHEDIFEDAVRVVSDQSYTSASFHLSYTSLKAVDLLVYLKNLESSFKLTKLLTLKLHLFL